MDAYKTYNDMNTLTATESGFGANAMEENGGISGKDVEWESAMDNLVSIISSDKWQIETIIATNAILVDQNKTMDMTIARMASENANLVLIITKMAGGNPSAAALLGAMGGGGKHDSVKLKNPDDTVRHLTQNGTVGCTGSVYTINTAAPCENGNVMDTKMKRRVKKLMGGCQKQKHWVKSK